MIRVRGKCSVKGCTNSHGARSYCPKHYARFMAHGDPNYEPRKRTPSQRFWAFVDKSGECWEWNGGATNHGYGVFGLAPKKMILAHRYAYEEAAGPIPEGMVIDHICHRTSCVRPLHLRAVTRKQNQENRFGASAANSYGLLGVGYNKRTKKYRVRVSHNGVEYRTGECATPEEAGEAARQLRLSLYSHNNRDRKSA